ncbi:MAG: sucrose-6-phosphate hydrolase [Bacillaceae bacterium]|nr:sucrose-6-phosphate hydrolase [Bacillaceae bacterium]
MDTSSNHLMSKALEEVKQHQQTVESDCYRLDYHIMPPVGLLNDPNGFIFYKGLYHLFYQWNPFKTAHGAKFWGHYTSADLVTWNHEKIALAPSDWFDKNGCYSGSAVEHDGKMKLFYTGNVKDEQGNRETYQCLAESENGLDVEKKGVVVNLPDGYTPHFRDPKVWEHEGMWYMIVGAQGLDKHGKAALLKSEDLTNWNLIGNVSGSNTKQLKEFGYMWECPDLFSLDGSDVLIVSPQGLRPEGTKYNNVYQSGYFIGSLDYHTGKMEHGSFTELDRGFEFYAPQTTVDPKGRRLLFAWMGVPEQDEDKHPTIKHQWVHAMTLPRELVLIGDKLHQKPPEELVQLRKEEISHHHVPIDTVSKQLNGVEGEAVELLIEFQKNDAQVFECSIRGEVRIIYRKEENLLTMERKSFVNRVTQSRHCHIDTIRELRLFLDHSSIELFVNGGEEVFTARYFPEKTNTSIRFRTWEGTVSCHIKKMELKKIAVGILPTAV